LVSKAQGEIAVIESSTDTEIVFINLVEHPGGPDGGTFARESKFGVGDDGKLFYNTGYPDSGGCDAFCDEPRSNFMDVRSREDALDTLKGELALQRSHVANLEALVTAFEDTTKEFAVLFENEAYVDGEDAIDDIDDEDDGDWDYEDEEDEE
jgi:hypothetical protein